MNDYPQIPSGRLHNSPVLIGAGRLFLITLVGLLLLRWSWLKWPDVLIDFGEQLYIAWQLSEGKVLYKDIFYLYGPLSSYLNSLWFRLIDVSLMTFVVANIIVLIGIVTLLYRLILHISNATSATVAALVLLVMFAFLQLVGIGNYNYLTPYENSVTYGMLLSLAALSFLAQFIKAGRVKAIAGTGLCLGLVMLTKAEIFLAAATGTALGLGLAIWTRRTERNLLLITGLFLGTLFLAPIAFVVFFSFQMPLAQAVSGTLGTWPAILGSEATDVLFYRQGMGTVDIGKSLRLLITWIGWYAAVLLPAAAIALMWRQPANQRKRRMGLAFAASLFVLVTSVLLFKLETIQWYEIARPLPVVILLFGVVSFIRVWKTRHAADFDPKLIIRLSLFAFAFVLLFKMILNTRIYHYGFVLAMPATILLVVALIDWVPNWITRSGGFGQIFSAFALAIILVVAVAHLRASENFFERKTVIVGNGRDRIRTDFRGRYINLALRSIEKHVRLDQTMAVFPEGVMLNYLSRRVTPVAHTKYIPFYMLIYGEDETLRSLQHNPPDFVLLVHRKTSRYGFRFFGKDYARNIFSWLQSNYENVLLVGDMPLQDDCRFGLLLLRRIGLQSSPSAREGGTISNRYTHVFFQ